MKLPDLPACGLMYAVVPVMNVFPVAPESVIAGALGAVVSTLTVVEMLTVLPTLSVPVRV